MALPVTSGGIPGAALGGSDWQNDYFAAFPQSARWIADPVSDLSDQIPLIDAPTLLLWGDADPISPVAVGERLLMLFLNACLRIFHGAGHDLARTHVADVADEVRRHLTAAA
jgi:pimeloyl-ACP methyl ester carboxylesterase